MTSWNLLLLRRSHAMRHLWARKRRLFLVLADLLLSVLAYVAANLIRFEGVIPARDWGYMGRTLPTLLVIRFFCFGAFRLYRGVWSYAGVNDLITVGKAVTVGSVALWVTLSTILGLPGHSRGVLVIDWLLLVVLVGGLRLSVRLWRSARHTSGQPVLIIGAGGGGERVVREFLRDPKPRFRPIGFLDDDPARLGVRIHGIPVLGTIEEVARIATARGISEVIIAIPSAGRRETRRIFDLCSEAGLAMKTMPSLGQLLDGTTRVSQVREVRLDDLLGREPVHLDGDAVRGYLGGRRVLVTGAGGSIGSEICRQVAAQEPALLVLLDKGENALFEIDKEMSERFPGVKRAALLVDITGRHKLDEMFRRYRPEVVFDAAAYKHVPLMEAHADEAVLNNVVGTRTLVEVAIAHRAAAFVLISTDKAVNPSSIMGATKRVAERYVRTLAANPARGETVLCAVRFGNVLGSSGSVVPLFKKQIEQGGPITVTHPEMSRYFMTIPEAVQFVLRATTLAQGGEIFVLEMGEPVRIADMARDLVRLSGLEVGEDIEIVFTGLRPGERLSEELWSGTEDVEPTVQDKLLVIRQPEAEGANLSRFLGHLSEMEELAKHGDVRGLIQAVRRVVPEYQPSSGLVPRRRVLIADDDPAVRQTLRDALDHACEVIEAQDGVEALTRARTTLPDVVLLDAAMPRVDGHSVVESLRADPRTQKLPIIMLSRAADVADKEKVLSLGADDYVIKPFQPQELEARIDAVLGRASSGSAQ